jgi:uncharacterized protein (TIGR02217 family)
MTLPIFPSNLVGLAWDVLKTSISSTRVLTARSGIEYRAANWSYGKYKWQLTYSVLRQNRNGLTELQTLLGFCLQMQGMYSSFLYTDPTDNSVTLQGLGSGNSTQTVFPLVRTFGGVTEPNLVANSVSAVYLNGTPTSAYTLVQVGAYGIDAISFNSAPGAGVLITATFTYYFPVRFLQDDPEFNNFSYQFWALKKISFQSVK